MLVLSPPSLVKMQSPSRRTLHVASGEVFLSRNFAASHLSIERSYYSAGTSTTGPRTNSRADGQVAFPAGNMGQGLGPGRVESGRTALERARGQSCHSFSGPFRCDRMLRETTGQRGKLTCFREPELACAEMPAIGSLARPCGAIDPMILVAVPTRRRKEATDRTR